MGWRPEGWEEIKGTVTKHHAYLQTMNDRICFTAGFEAGAAAMLEALKVSEVHLYINNQNVVSINFSKTSFPCKGWLVFIPDEETQ